MALPDAATMHEFSRHAAFRFQVVSQVLSRMLAGETQREAVFKVAELRHYFPGVSHPRRVSERAIYRWLAAYHASGLEGIETSARPVSAGPGGVLPPKFVEEHLPEPRYRVHYVKVSDLSKRDMCREIAAAAGVPPAGAYNYIIRNLQARYLAFSDTDGLRPVLLIDDAHELRADVLGILRVLTNFEMDSRLVLSVILCGQPPLRDLLRRGDLEDIAKRLVHYATLRLLSRTETEAYIAHRSNTAGAITVPFDASSIDAIYEIGHGNLRATDTLAMKALEIAHDQNAATVDHNHVIGARKVLWP